MPKLIICAKQLRLIWNTTHPSLINIFSMESLVQGVHDNKDHIRII